MTSMTSIVETEHCSLTTSCLLFHIVVTILHQFSVLIPLLHYVAEKHNVRLFLQGNAATELRCGGKFQSALRRRLFLSQCRKSHQNRTAITKVVAMNFKVQFFCNSAYFSLEDRSSLNNHKCQHYWSGEITEQENKTWA